MPHHITLAGPGDVPALVGLMADFYAEAGYPLPREAAARAFAALLSDTHLGRIWLIVEGQRPVGYLVLVLAFSMEYGGLRGFIDDFFVRPDARNRGLGGVVLNEVRGWCVANGVRALLVETGAADHPARRLYARAGFVDTGHPFLAQPLAAPLHEARS